MEGRWKVGELARRTGVSVRTLHHYDEIGLLSPRERTPSGHRLYGPAEVRRLQQVVSLREVGLSLEEIGRLLDGGRMTLAEAVGLHVERLREELHRAGRLLRLLEELHRRLEAEGEELPLEEVTRTLSETLRHRRYFSSEQLDTLARRGAELGEDGLRAGEEAWAEVMEGFRLALERGADPASPEVGALARRAARLVEDFTGGDPAMAASLGSMYEKEGPDAVLGPRGVELPPGLWEYMARARAALDG